MNEELKKRIHTAIAGSDDPKSLFDDLFNWLIFTEKQFVDNNKPVVSKEVR